MIKELQELNNELMKNSNWHKIVAKHLKREKHLEESLESLTNVALDFIDAFCKKYGFVLKEYSKNYKRIALNERFLDYKNEYGQSRGSFVHGIWYSADHEMLGLIDILTKLDTRGFTIDNYTLILNT